MKQKPIKEQTENENSDVMHSIILIWLSWVINTPKKYILCCVEKYLKSKKKISFWLEKSSNFSYRSLQAILLMSANLHQRQCFDNRFIYCVCKFKFLILVECRCLNTMFWCTNYKKVVQFNQRWAREYNNKCTSDDKPTMQPVA